MRNRHQKKQNFNKAFEVNSEITNIDEAVRIRSAPVVWGIPMDEVCYSKFWTNFVRCSGMMPWDGFITTESTYLPDARNTIHQRFVKDSDIDYLMMVDSDILFPPHMVEKLMSYDLPIVGGWYHNKKGNNRPVVYDFVSESPDGNDYLARPKPGKGIERVDGMGAGCWLMKREIALQLGERPYDMQNGGEDLRLCKKLSNLGIPLHVDWEMPLAHVGVFFV